MAYFRPVERIQEPRPAYRGLFIPDIDLPPPSPILPRLTPSKQLQIEYDPILGGWWQNDTKLPNFRPQKFFTRPHDGKRPGALGRLKDAFTGEGADVFVTLSGSKRGVMRDRVPRHQWTNSGEDEEMWEEWRRDPEHRVQDEMWPTNAPWTKEREGRKEYNFRTRKFEAVSGRWLEPGYFWSDARWPEGVERRSGEPLRRKDAFGRSYERVPRGSRVYLV